jgi:hypothetical protein
VLTSRARKGQKDMCNISGSCGFTYLEYPRQEMYFEPPDLAAIFIFIFQGSFYLLGYGLCLSLFVFIWEIFIYKYLKLDTAVQSG